MTRTPLTIVGLASVAAAVAVLSLSCDDPPMLETAVEDVGGQVESLQKNVEQFRSDTRNRIRKYEPDTGIPEPSGPTPAKPPSD